MARKGKSKLVSKIYVVEEQDGTDSYLIAFNSLKEAVEHVGHDGVVVEYVYNNTGTAVIAPEVVWES